MNKILKFFKRRILCMNGRSNQEMANATQLSPRVTRSRSKTQQIKRQKLDEDKPSKKTGNVGRPKGKRKGDSGEIHSMRAHRGSIGSRSLLQTPKTCEDPAPKTPLLTSPARPPPTPRSPPLCTISAETPLRNARFYKSIEDVVGCRLRILGKGSFGTIIQATYKGELVAAKIVPPHKTSTLKNELNNFLLSHPNIVKTLRIICNEENLSCGLVIMEMCSSSTLEHLADEDSYVLDEKSVVRFMTEVGSALDYCHSQRVLHLDVKPQNILVNLTTNVCKLCDFGSSRLLMGEDTVVEEEDQKALQSTIVYTSPELLTGGLPTDKSDVYSFGITLWQVVHREKPYVVDNKIDLQLTIYKIVKQKKRPQRKNKKDRPLEKLYTKCWDHEPSKRPTMKEILQYLSKIHTT